MLAPMLTIPLLVFSHLLLLLAQGTPTPTDSGIPPGVWELVSYTETDDMPVAIVDPTRYTLQFQPDGQLLAQFDCNHGSGQYTAVAGALTISPMISTLILCPPDSQVTQFQLLLDAVTSYEIDAEGDLILRGDAGALHFRPASPEAPS